MNPINLKTLRWFILIPLIIIGFWLRLTYTEAGVFHTDEYFSMLAAQTVAQRGTPVFPSGLFYDHGIFYSMVAGGFVYFLNFSEWIARWPVIVFSMLTIAAYYFTARQLFGSHLAGFLAALLYTFDPLSIKWGVWARMYTMTHIFVMLSLGWLLLSTLKTPSHRKRFIFLIFFAGALFSHTLTLFLLPPLALLLLIFVLIYRREILLQPILWLQAVIGGAILAAALWVISLGQVGSIVRLQDPQGASEPPLGIEILRGFFLPSLDPERFRPFYSFYSDVEYRWFFPLITLGVLLAIYRIWQRQYSFAEIALLFVTAFPLLVIVEMATLLTDDWRKGVYMFILTLPGFMLAAAGSLALWIDLIAKTVSSRMPMKIPQPSLQLASTIFGIALILLISAPRAWDTVGGQSTGGYYSAWPYIDEHRQPEDKVMSGHPASAYLYLGQHDYYLNPLTAKVLPIDADNWIDRYTGSPLIKTVDDFSDTLAKGEGIWFVLEKKFIDRKYDHSWIEQIFAQMNVAHQAGQVYIFRSEAFPRPVLNEPDVLLDANFNHSILLGGYTLDSSKIAPDGTTLLSLYWRPLGDHPPINGDPPKQSKVFVQLRDGQNQTISQADHFIFEGLLTNGRFRLLKEEGEWLRDTAYLPVPIPLAPENGPYQIYIGFYHPDTFERTWLVNDTSGENAVVIDFPLPSSETGELSLK